MEDLIPVVNKLQDVFSAIGQQSLDLPQIIVVGSQSSGKSSVIESIVGRDFLPRGSGIVTRRPLVLQLFNIKNDISQDNNSEGEEWGEFLHSTTGQRYYDFNDIRKEIQRETDRITGKNKAISDKTINLRIYSPHVLNLTLVDLPGITRIPTGDQPQDIEEQIRTMCLQFISSPSAIILAVSAANQDLTNSDGLQLARLVDPDGLRTIGVITKVDIMDQGTDCVDILSNRVFPLRRGYIAVANRSQKDINDNVSVRQGLEKEQNFFQIHPRYRSMISKCGSQMLASTLNQILMNHIRECLPSIKSRISSMLSEVQCNLEALGGYVDDNNPNRRGEVLLKLISNFSTNVSNYIEGGKALSLGVRELCGGARIGYVFNDIFAKRLTDINTFDGLSDQDIQTAMANANGVRHPLFIPEASFDLLVRKQITRLEEPGLQCVDLVYDEMIRMCLQSDTTELSRFPLLRDRLFEVVNALLHGCVKPCQAMISNLVKVELAHINTSHPDFIGGKKAIIAQQKVSSNTLAPNVVDNSTSDIPVQSKDSFGKNDDLDSDQRLKNVTVRHSTSSSKPAASTPPVAVSAPAVPSTESGAALAGGVGTFFNLFRAPAPNESSASNYTVNSSHGNNSISDEGSSIKLKQVPDKMKPFQVSSGAENRVEIKVIKTLIISYFDIVKKNFVDLVPKIIMHFLVNTFKETLQNELVSNLYREQLLSELMRETDEVASRRSACLEMRDLLSKAMEIVNESCERPLRQLAEIK